MQAIILWRKAVTVLQDGTVGRIYKSAPTVFINYMAHSGSICAMTVLFQQSQFPSFGEVA